MFHIVFIALTVALTWLCWELIKSSPRVLSMVLPKKLTFGIGLGLFVIAMFSAVMSTFDRDPQLLLESFVEIYVGLWLMLATSAGLRGSYEDDQMLRRVFTMMGLVTAAMIGFLYVPTPQLAAVLNLVLVLGGFWVMLSYFRFLDRGR